MRFQRTVASISVCSSICPICRAPVTFGGGITMEKTGFPCASVEARYKLRSTHKRAHFGSIPEGSYDLASSSGMKFNRTTHLPELRLNGTRQRVRSPPTQPAEALRSMLHDASPKRLRHTSRPTHRAFLQ